MQYNNYSNALHITKNKTIITQKIKRQYHLYEVVSYQSITAQ